MAKLARPVSGDWTGPEVYSVRSGPKFRTRAPRFRPLGPPVEDLRFPGCRAIRLTREQYKDFDERLEFWDARSETAWVMADLPGGVHEGTAWRLAHVAERISLVRGSPIVSLGSVGLLVQDDEGRPARGMQADATLYLHPRKSRMPTGSLIIGEDERPDVVLEVDHTTDVRPGKLPLYEAWGFPELWVIVPPREKPRRRRPEGVTIHRLQGGRYRSLPESIAFPGWTAAEIHAALTERTPSAETDRVLERVGRTMGAREGTVPEDTPLLRSLGGQARAEARAAGRARGIEEGIAAGRAEELAAAVRSVLVARGIPLSDPDALDVAALRGSPRDVLLAAALAAVDEADFHRRIGSPTR